MFAQSNIRQQLQSLLYEIQALEGELADLLADPQSNLAVRRDIKRIRRRLADARQKKGALERQQAAERMRFSSSAELESDPESSRDLPTLPEGAGFAAAVRLAVQRLATTPASLREEYSVLIEEGEDSPLDEMASELRTELLSGLLSRSEFTPEQLTPLQDEYLDALVARLVGQALRDLVPAEVRFPAPTL